jgi:hypothetical protein
MATQESHETGAEFWWNARLPRYNAWLVGAGLLGFLLYAAVIEVACTCDSEAEITLFAIPFQALGYLFAMAVANLCYSLGYIVERILKPRDVARYRRVTFAAGVGLSVAPPLLVPALAYLGCACGP